MVFQIGPPAIAPGGSQFASLAQLVEHLTLNQGVRGSSPRWSTNKKDTVPIGAVFFFISIYNHRLETRTDRVMGKALPRSELAFYQVQSGQADYRFGGVTDKESHAGYCRSKHGGLSPRGGRAPLESASALCPRSEKPERGFEGRQILPNGKICKARNGVRHHPKIFYFSLKYFFIFLDAVG